MKLRSALESDLPALIALWQAVFGDNEDFIRAFYEASSIDRTIVAAADGELVGMINCPEIELWAKGKRYRGAYVYALAVDAHYRSAGIGSALLKAAEMSAYLPEIPQFLMLIPAEASLFEFYKKMGYNREAFAPLTDRERLPLEGKIPLAHDSDLLYRRYLAACQSEGAEGGVFVKSRAIFALSMQGASCYADEEGYIALDSRGKILEIRPSAPHLSRKMALWKALTDIPDALSPLISRFMEE